VNKRICASAGNDATMSSYDEMPKVTFSAKETYEEVQKLSQKIPIWNKPA